MFTIEKEFSFSASHRLEGLSDSHPCSRLHGHNYTVIFTLWSGNVNEIGFVRDYREISEAKEWIDKVLDHRHLNDVLYFNPTAELLAKFIFEKFSSAFPELQSVTVRETDKTSARYER